MQIRKYLLSLLKSTEGVAMVEFALVLPILLIMFLNGYEMNRYLIVHQKVEKVAYTVTDVVTQSSALTISQLNQILSAATELMNPYSFTNDGVVILSSIYQSGTTNPPIIRWQYTGGGSLAKTSLIGTAGGNATLPSGFTLNDRDNIIIAEVYYHYTPILSGTLVNTTDIYKTAIYRPRLGALTTPPT